MSKAIWHEKQILIVLLWSVLIFIGYHVLTAEASEKEKDFLSPENVDRSITFIGENEPGFIKTPEQKRAEELETIADIEDDLADANTSKEKEKIQGELDAAREKFGLDKDKEKLTGYDEEGRQLNVINGDYDEEPKQIEDWKNTVEPTNGGLTIASPYVVVPYNEDDSQEEIDEKKEKAIAEYNKEAGESHDGEEAEVNEDDNTQEADSSEENASEDEDSGDGGNEESEDDSGGEEEESSDDGGDESEEE